MAGKGLVHIYTGDGKGKTTASIGLAVRAAGQGEKVLIVQFFKEDGAASGEAAFLRGAQSSIELVRSNCRHPIFTGEKTDFESVKRSVRETFENAKRKAAGGDIGLLVLDEIMAAINGGWIGVDEVIEFLDKRPVSLEVVMTGRNAPPELVMRADYVTEMLKIKHPFDKGTPARKGVEF